MLSTRYTALLGKVDIVFSFYVGFDIGLNEGVEVVDDYAKLAKCGDDGIVVHLYSFVVLVSKLGADGCGGGKYDLLGDLEQSFCDTGHSLYVIFDRGEGAFTKEVADVPMAVIPINEVSALDLSGLVGKHTVGLISPAAVVLGLPYLVLIGHNFSKASAIADKADGVAEQNKLFHFFSLSLSE